MEFPTFLEIDGTGKSLLEESLPDDFVCYVCLGPLLKATNTVCRHRVCSRCAATLEDYNNVECGVCRIPRNREVDEALNARVEDYVLHPLVEVAHQRFQVQYPLLLKRAIEMFAPRFVNRDTMQLNLGRLSTEVDKLIRFQQRFAEIMAEVGSEYKRVVTCVSRKELAAVPRKGQVLILCVVGSTWFGNLSALSKFTGLQGLYLASCDKLSTLRGLDRVPTITHLFVERCHSIDGLGLENLQRLRSVFFDDCAALKRVTLPRRRDTSICADEGVDTGWTDGVVAIDACPHFQHLLNATPSSLHLSVFSASETRLCNLKALQFFRTLTMLDLNDCYRITNFSLIQTMTHLTYLSLSRTRFHGSLAVLAELTQLENLILAECRVGGNLMELQRLTNLKVFIADRTNVTSLEGLSQRSTKRCVMVGTRPRPRSVESLSQLAR